MDVVNESGYKIPPEFQDYAKDPLVDLNLTDSTELWLIQSASDQLLDFDGQEVSVDISHNEELGTFEGSSGESYIIDHSAHDVDTTVFLPSRSVPKIAGKIDRLVTFVQYTDPSKVPEEESKRLLMEKSTTSLTNSGRPTPAKSRTNLTHSSRPTSMLTYGSGRKSFLSEKESSKSATKRHREKSMTSDQTAQGSERSHDKKSKRK